MPGTNNKGVNSSSPTTAIVLGGVYNATPPVLQDGQAAAVQLNSDGSLKTSGGGGGGSDVNIVSVGGAPEALDNPLPVELSDGTQSVGTAGNPLSVNVISGGGSNASVGVDGAMAPTSATEIGTIDAGGKLQGVSAANPLPITGTISVTATNPSVGLDNATAPTSATEIGTIDAGGKLQGVSAANPLPISGSISATNPSVGPDNVTAPTSDTLIGTVDAGGKVQAVSAANPLPISGSISASNPSVGTDNVTAPTSATEIGSIDGSGKLQGASTTNPVPVALPAATVSTLTPPTAAAIGTAVAAPSAAAIAAALANPLPVSLPSATVTTLTPPTATAIGTAVAAPTAAAIGTAVSADLLVGTAAAGSSVPVALPTATILTLTPPTAAAIGTAVAAPTAAAIASAIVSNPPTISIASAQKVEVYDGTNTATVKAASSQSVTTDTSLVVQINPEQPNLTTALNVHDASPASQAVTQGTAANLNATVTPAASVAFPIADSQGTRQSVTFVTATPADTANTVAISTYANVAVTLHYSGSVTGGVMFFEISDDNSNWYGLTMAPISQDSAPIDSYTLSSAAGNVSWQMFIGAYAYFRVRMHTQVVGAGSAIVAIIPSVIASEPAVALAGGSAAVTNIGTFAVQEATLDGCISSNIVAVHDASPASQAVTNVGTFAVQAACSGTVTTTPPSHASTNVDQLAGTTVDTNSGNKSAGTLRVVVATDQPNLTTALNVHDASPASQAVTNTGTFATQDSNLSGCISASKVAVSIAAMPSTPVTGTFYQATQPVSIASAQVASGAFASGAIADGAQVTLGTKADAKDAHTDSTAITAMQVLKEISYMEQTPASRAVTNAGTFAVQNVPTDGTHAISAAMSAIGVAPTGTYLETVNAVSIPYTSGGLSVNLQTALKSTAQSVKASAGQIYGYTIFNPNAAVVYVSWYDASSTPTVGTSMLFAIGIPAGAAANVSFDLGVAVVNKIYVGASTAISSAADPTTGVVVTTIYK